MIYVMPPHPVVYLDVRTLTGFVEGSVDSPREGGQARRCSSLVHRQAVIDHRPHIVQLAIVITL